MKKSLEKSQNVLEEKRKNGQAKNLLKKDQHVYNTCEELLRERLMTSNKWHHTKEALGDQYGMIKKFVVEVSDAKKSKTKTASADETRSP